MDRHAVVWCTLVVNCSSPTQLPSRPLESLSCLLTIMESFDKNNPEIGTESLARQMHQKTVQHYWVNIDGSRGGECPTLKETLIQPIEAAQIQTTLLAQAQVLLRKTIGELRYNKSQRSTRGAFCRICKECMVIDKPARSGREESKSVLEFQVQIKRKKPARIRWKLLRMVKLDWWKACNKTDEGWPATGLVTFYQPDGADTLPEFEVEIQRPQKRVKCRQRAWLWLLWEF